MQTPVSTSAYYVRQAFSNSDRMAGTVAAWKEDGASVTQSAAGQTSALGFAESHIAPTGVTAPSFSFGELLDIINPLQHIPFVSGYYRDMTGDTISPVAQIAGGALYGGVLGGVASLINAAIQEHSGNQTVGSVATALASDTNNAYALVDDERMAGSLQGNEKRESRASTRVQLAENTETVKSPYHFND